MMLRFVNVSPAIALIFAASAAFAQNPVQLAPGERILETYVVPSAPIIRIPLDATKRLGARPAPPLEIDRVTNRPRNQTGWSGNTQRPAATACFPSDAC